MSTDTYPVFEPGQNPTLEQMVIEGISKLFWELLEQLPDWVHDEHLNFELPVPSDLGERVHECLEGCLVQATFFREPSGTIAFNVDLDPIDA